MKIAVLICDIPRQDLSVKHGNYHQMFQKIFPLFKLEDFNVLEQVYPQDLDEYDAYLLTGSSILIK